MKIRKYLAGLITMLGMLVIGFNNTGVLHNVFAASENVVDTEAELKEALVNGGEVTLQGDIVVNKQIDIPSNVTTTLDLNGFDITSGYQEGSSTKHIYPFSNNGKFIIKDSAGEGSITGRGIYNQAGASLTLEGVKVISQDTNGGACVWSFGADSKVYLNDAILVGYTGCVSSEGYVEINGGTYTCYSGVLDDGTIATSPTYNIRAYNGLKITDGDFTSRHGVISIGGGEAIIEGGSYTIEFYAALTSNVLYVYGDTDLTINGGEFLSDDSKNIGDSGTAVLVAGSIPEVTINDGTFVGMNGMVSINDNTVINGGSYETVFGYNDYGSIESAVAKDATIEIAKETYTKTENGLEEVTVAAKIGDVEYSS